MTSENFIDAIREVVAENSVISVQSNLIKPPGRKPSEKLVMMSEWYNKLVDGDKGELKLYYEKGNYKILLNDPHNVNLHELL